MTRPSKPKKKNMRQIAFTRFMLIVAFFVLWIGGIGVRLFHLQVTEHASLRERALDLRQDVKNDRMLRGTIYDRNERMLAVSLPVKTLWANPSEMTDIDMAAKTIAKILKLDANQIANQLTQAKEANKKYIAVAKKLEEDAVQKLNKALDEPGVKKADAPNFNGLHWIDDQKRSYPYQTLAAQVIGYSNAEDDGQAGIEQSQDDILHGAVIRKVRERDRLGRVYDETVPEREKPSDIVLTIDYAFQHMVEEALEKGVKAAEAKSGMAIVMNPKNGEILAMANSPTFDPNGITDSVKEFIRNNTIQSSYSPGSAFKIVTYGSALERHLFQPDDMINAGNGTIEVANHVFSDHHTGTMSYSEALAHSSNICAIKTGLTVGKTDFFSMIQKMGFGSRTGIELPAETSGIVHSPDKWFGDSLASMSIGYEINVTALQMTTAFATIANDGVRIQPHIIKEIRRSDEQPKSITQPSQTQVFSKETARNLKKMLRQVVLTGTGKKAQLNGYTAAGKTGTAWKVNNKAKSVDSSKYISSFIGMAPADNPEIVVAVIMDEPKVGARDGGMVSAPVFHDIAQQILAEMKVANDAPIRQETQIAQNTHETPEAEKPVNDKPQKGALPKRGEPAAEKTKPKDIKKTKDKSPVKNGRMTARRNDPDDRQEIKRTDEAKLET
ncbi:MAG TPA: penicillin-binding protein 2 [Pyrinomonadaceae bacterium]|nr:penicillin-binding protein 2 [Pyrinomonadaceae bacterium]